MQKLRHINKEKNFLEWPRKRRNPEDQLAAQPDGVPRCPAYVGLCAALAAGARKYPLAPISAPVGPFLRGVWEGRTFQVRVGQPGK